MSRAIGVLALALAAGCRSSNEPATADVLPGPPRTVIGEIRRTRADERDAPKLFLVPLADPEAARTERAAHGERREFAFTDVAPGRYRLTLEFELARNGPTVLDHRELVITPEHGARVVFGEPASTGALRIRADRHTPPFALFLARPDVDAPATLQELGRRWPDDGPPSDEISFWLTDDGHGPFDDVPPIPAGHYTVVLCAIDWEPGDPAPRPRAWPLHGPDGGTRTLSIRERLTVLEIR